MTPGTAPSAGLPTTGRLRIASAYYVTYVVLGLMLTCIGPSLDALQAQSGSTTEAIALLFTANSLGYIAGSLLAPRLYGRFRGNRVLCAALLVLALLAASVPALGSLEALLVVFTLIGVPLGVMDVGGNTLIVWLFRSDVPPYMNALHLSFGLGAFAGPLVFDRLAVATGNAATTYWLFAALMVPIAAWLARLAEPESPEAVASAGTSGILRPYMLLIALIGLFFFLHMGAEMAFGGWIYTYADDVTGSATVARLVNSMFWGGLVAGRLVATLLAIRVSPAAMLQLDLLGAVAGLGILALFPDSVAALWVGTIVFGFAVASLIPSSFNLAERRIPITSRVSSIFLVGGSLGSMTLPWLVGQLFVPYGRISMVYVVGAAMLGAWLILVAILRVHRAPVGRGVDAAPAPAS